MKVLVLGGNGMLGHKLVQHLSSQFDVWTTVRQPFESIRRFGIFSEEKTLDRVHVDDASILEGVIAELRPDVVINAIGVIKQRPSSRDVITTLTVNSILPHRLCELSRRLGFRLICVSTDCVFSGDKGMYIEADPSDASDLYGRSKSLGEVTDENCLTVRTSIIGRELASNHSMVEWFLSNRGGKVNGYANAIYSGFPTIVFADIIRSLLFEHRQLRGLYHISSDPIDKYSLLVLANQAYGANVTIEPDESFRLDRSLDSSKFRQLTGFQPKPWEEMVEQMANDPTPYEEWRK